MLVNFTFAPHVIDLLDAAVASHWPDSLPWHHRIKPDDADEKTLFFWNLSPDSRRSICMEALSVHITGLQVTMREHARLDMTCERIRLIHHASQITPEVMETSLDIGIASLQLPHEFAKRITELRHKFETSLVKAA